MTETTLNLPLLRGRIRQLYGTQSEFAARCGWSRQYVSRLLEGKSSVSLRRAMDIAVALDIQIDELLSSPGAPYESAEEMTESLEDVLREVVGKYAYLQTSADEFAARKNLEKDLED